MQEPNNIEVEQAVLGALLSETGNIVWPQVSGLLQADHFSEAVHARIFEAVATLSAGGKSASAFSLKNHFDSDATLNEIGGLQYLARLVGCAAPSISLKSHAELLRDLAARRSAIAAAEDLIGEAQSVSINEPFRPTLKLRLCTIVWHSNGQLGVEFSDQILERRRVERWAATKAEWSTLRA